MGLELELGLVPMLGPELEPEPELEFPIQHCLVDERAEVSCNFLVENLVLAVALRVVQGCCQVLGSHEHHQFIPEFVAKLLSLIGDNLQWDTITAEPTFQQSFGHGAGLFVGNYNQYDVLGQGVRHGEHILLVSFRSHKRSEEVSMNLLVWLGSLWHWLEQ